MDTPYEVRFCEDKKGLGLFATRDIKQNDVILEEAPLVCAQFLWNEALGYLACHHCLRSLEGAEENVRRITKNENIILPFPELCPTNKNDHRYCELCGVGYCSENCKQASWNQYHQYICFQIRPELKKLCDAWREIHYPPEQVSIMLVARIFATIELASDKESVIKIYQEFIHETAEERDGALLKLLGKEISEKLNKLRMIMNEVFPVPHCDGFVSEEGFMSLIALIGRNAQGIGTSSLSIWVKRVEELKMTDNERKEIDSFIDKIYQEADQYVGSFLNNEGSGLYRIERCINHSCAPNAVITFPHGDYTLSLVAISDIKAGEEIFISYISECQLERSRHTRNKALKEFYLFECKCKKCLQEADDPDVTSEEEEEEEDDDDEEHAHHNGDAAMEE